ncbi:hypothetical protein GA0115246_110314 [Streptomyces sp. SolWspMP-sol7th]|nr:hypothetical protein GA0115246_110314 [Streptomyces sp. SolWspMP-sol7th]
MPWYLPRSRGGTSAPISAKAPAPMPPAPSPCTTRKAMSAFIDGASPHATDVTRKSTTEARKTRLRSKRSPSLPHTAVEHAVARV